MRQKEIRGSSSQGVRRNQNQYSFIFRGSSGSGIVDGMGSFPTNK